MKAKYDEEQIPGWVSALLLTMENAVTIMETEEAFSVKKTMRVLLIIAVILGIVALLLILGEKQLLDDGGSRFCKSTLRMEAQWVYFTTSGKQTVHCVYWFSETLKSVDELINEAFPYSRD